MALGSCVLAPQLARPIDARHRPMLIGRPAVSRQRARNLLADQRRPAEAVSQPARPFRLFG